MATYDQIRDEVQSWLDEASNTSTTKTNVGYAINLAHEQRCTESNWTFMEWPQPETFNLVSGTRYYNLHPEVDRMIYVFNRTSKSYLIETPQRQLEPTGVRWNTDTSGQRYRFAAPSPVSAQPSSADTITVTSSSASDTGSSKAVLIRGVVSGVVLTESITPTGTSAATSTNSYSLILNLDLAAAWTGTATIATTGGTTLATIPASVTNLQYPRIEMLWTPSTTDTIEYRFYRRPRRLSNDGDVVEIPEPFSRILVWDSLLIFAAYDGDINSGRMSIWTGQRDKILHQMQQTYLEGQTVAAEPRYVRSLDDTDSYTIRVGT